MKQIDHDDLEEIELKWQMTMLIMRAKSESVANVFNVESSPYNPSNDMSKTHRPYAPIVEDWISDSKDETEIKAVPKQREPSFVTSTKPVKSSRESVKKVEHHKQAKNLRTNN
nr:hypothetical protein [Tanacetum cinerariifolium]